MSSSLIKDKISKILIIDDEDGVRKTLRKIMEREGYEVDTAESSEAALQLLKKVYYDTIITDIYLPGMNGIELLKRIREHDPDIPVIVITGYPNVDSATEAVRQMAYDYVSKPVTKHNLPPIVIRAVEKKLLREEKNRLEKENLEYQKELEKKVEERTKEIIALNKAIKESQERLLLQERLATLGTFISFISHDLRNPLSVIQNSIFYLKTRIKTEDEKVHRYFGIIEEELGIANNIIEGFLKISRGSPPKLEPVNVNDLIKRIIDILITIPEHIKLVLKPDKGISEINLDKDQIQQVLINIIGNAIQAMPEGGELTIGTCMEDENVIINIQDTGTGISEDDLEKLFDPFFSTKKKGTGLGLVICKFLTERHGGKITVTSELGKGSKFTLSFPLKPSKYLNLFM